jgi:hypothetical protein
MAFRLDQEPNDAGSFDTAYTSRFQFVWIYALPVILFAAVAAALIWR